MLRLRQFAAALAALVLLATPGSAGAAEPRDYDRNAIMYGGAYSVSEWERKFREGDTLHSKSDIQGVFSAFNISPATMRQTQSGTVTREGRVIVDGRTVATDARSAGRARTDGSTPRGGVYLRPTSESFQTSSLPAFVYMRDGVFQYAVIKSCANPVVATPVKASPAPAPAKPAVAPTPAPRAEEKPRPEGKIAKEVIADNGEFIGADARIVAVTRKPGETFQYRILVENKGNAPLTNVVVRDTLPAGIELVSDPARREIEHPMADIPAGAARVLNLTVRVTSQKDDEYINNIACFSAAGGQKDCNNAYIRTDVPPAAAPAAVTPPVPEQPSASPAVVQPVRLPEAGSGVLAAVAGMGALGLSLRSYLSSRRRLHERRLRS